MATENSPQARHENLVVQEFKNELLIYDLSAHKAFSLNETSALIWQSCDGNNSAADISRAISKKLKQPISEDFVRLALGDLKKENLLANGEEIETGFAGMSRREAIRRIGLASLVALPVISSLVVPTAAAAASGAAVCTGTVPRNGVVGGCNFTCSGPNSAAFCNQIYCNPSDAAAFCKSCSARSVKAPYPGSPCNYNCVCN